MTPEQHEALLRRVVQNGDWLSAERATRAFAWCEACRAMARGARWLMDWTVAAMRRRIRA
ncbi:hypothetical protein [Sabulicella glaciei]|uniref:Zf-HC2 domain-containing protein n=1 Tax=Sabulicella glaciei TaxID=2984948 RepID=A0ABT3NVH4_9PROT|nr:hypothetical protein [Roseococcus sp. MDT2-1-1]MCW8086147.1 hypothetical protein [Roseococcus sp. MDT2-1-1]